MHLMRTLLIAGFCLITTPADAQFITVGTGGLHLLHDIPEAANTIVPAIEAASDDPEIEWIDVTKMIDQYRIPEKMADLRAVTVDSSGKNAGFYFASGTKKSITVYRNGSLMQKGYAESVYDLEKPVVFRMTASGDLLYALNGTDLYVNATPVSNDRYSFTIGVESVHEQGGLLTFPEGGNIVTYDIASDRKTVLHAHKGAVQYVRRSGDTVAYTLRERTGVHMYRDGRIVSTKHVENPHNFAASPSGDVYFFVKASRGYALYRNARSYVTGKGAGAYVDVDEDGHIWHVSYAQTFGKTTVRLQRDRSPVNHFPGGVVNVELLLEFLADEYVIRASFADDPSTFFLVRDGEITGNSFVFEYPYNDTHGFLLFDDGVVFRAFNGGRWKAFVDGIPLRHPRLNTVWFVRVVDGALSVYATK
jgi:hypothetical protein